MMNNSDTTVETNKILEVIQKEHIVPRPRWYWVLRRAILWVPGVITTLIGAYAIAGILFALTHIEWGNRLYVNYSGPSFIFAMLPLLWIVSFTIFSLLSIYMLRKTSEGYRHRRRNLLLGSALGSVVIGILFYNATERLNLESLSGYRYTTQRTQQRLWHNPVQGRVAGMIEGIDEKKHTVVLVDITGKRWLIDTTQLGGVLNPATVLTQPIRIVGIAPEKNSLIACFVLPWEFPLDIKPARGEVIGENIFSPLFGPEAPNCDDAFGYLKD